MDQAGPLPSPHRRGGEALSAGRVVVVGRPHLTWRDQYVRPKRGRGAARVVTVPWTVGVTPDPDDPRWRLVLVRPGTRAADQLARCAGAGAHRVEVEFLPSRPPGEYAVVRAAWPTARCADEDEHALAALAGHVLQLPTGHELRPDLAPQLPWILGGDP